MKLSKKRKILSEIFFHFLNFVSISNISKRKITVIADIFLKLPTPKKVVR